MRVINKETLKEWFDLTSSGENGETILEKIANTIVEEAKRSRMDLTLFKELDAFINEYTNAVVDKTILSQPEVNAINKTRSTSRVEGSLKAFPLNWFEPKNMSALIRHLRSFDRRSVNPITGEVTDLFLEYANRCERTLRTGVVAGVSVRLRGLATGNTAGMIENVISILRQGCQTIEQMAPSTSSKRITPPTTPPTPPPTPPSDPK